MRRKDREVTDINEITGILDRCRTAVISMIDDGAPYAVPLSYGYEFEKDALILYFHCAKEGRKTDILKRNNKVCFTIFNEGKLLYSEVPCGTGQEYSSIIGSGEAVFIENPADKGYALAKMFAHQTGKDVEFTTEQVDAVCVFKIVSKEYSGKRRVK
ncbi:MAG: pyridoxamine 5'-phosphate oxidase family protein [Butyrivibrio sp.]|nr:pyridoxamine 5'-phosphate oxidase family protein [Butyrivibrio sp.]